MIGYTIDAGITDSLHTNYLSIPIAIVAYNSRALYSSYLLLEYQLNAATDPEIHTEINNLAQRLFNAWVALEYRIPAGAEHDSN